MTLDNRCEFVDEKFGRRSSDLEAKEKNPHVRICGGVPVLDLDYREDSDAETDMNVVMNDGGAFIEVQGTAEGHAFRRNELDSLLDLAAGGIQELLALQRAALSGNG